MTGHLGHRYSLGAMGLFNWFSNTDPFCNREFKPLFSAFIDAVIDSSIAGDPTVAPPRPSGTRAARHKSVLPAVKRIVAIGDVHGDMSQMKKALKAAGLIDDNFRWSGGSTVAVQVCSLQWRKLAAGRRLGETAGEGLLRKKGSVSKALLVRATWCALQGNRAKLAFIRCEEGHKATSMLGTLLSTQACSSLTTSSGCTQLW
jgi:hypothetical protein